jgi:hypothetical protein
MSDRLRDADRAANARARLYAGELRALLGRFEDEQRDVDWPEEQADAVGVLFADVRGVLNRMDAGGFDPRHAGRPIIMTGDDFDALVAEREADVLPFSKRAQLEHAGAGIGMKNGNVTPFQRTVSKLRRRKPVGVIVADIWREGLGPCAVCTVEGGSCRGPVQGHHIVSRQTLRRLGHLDFLLDKRNRLPVCEHRHEQHTTAYKPIPREALPVSVFEFAHELGLTWYLDRFYPSTDGAA